MKQKILSVVKSTKLRKGVAALVFGMAMFNVALTINPSKSSNSLPELSLSSTSAYSEDPVSPNNWWIFDFCTRPNGERGGMCIQAGGNCLERVGCS